MMQGARTGALRNTWHDKYIYEGNPLSRFQKLYPE